MLPDEKVWRHLVYLKYWTLNIGALMVYLKVPFPPNFSIKVALCCQHKKLFSSCKSIDQ